MSAAVTEMKSPAAPVASSARRRALFDNLWRAGIVALLIALWGMVSLVSDLVSSPAESMSALLDLFADGTIYRHLLTTLEAVLLGFAIAAAIGFPLGYLVGRSKFWGLVFDPIIAGAFAIPRVVFFPVLLTLFGVGVGAQSGMAALAAVFPIMVSTTSGVRAISPLLPKLGRSLGLTPFQMLSKIFVPAMAPTLMVGIRIGFSIAFINVIIAEFFAARAGLGLLALRAYGRLDLPSMYGIIVLLALMALLVNSLLWVAERRLARSQ